jgi:hypothetical protein
MIKLWGNLALVGIIRYAYTVLFRKSGGKRKTRNIVVDYYYDDDCYYYCDVLE